MDLSQVCRLVTPTNMAIFILGVTHFGRLQRSHRTWRERKAHVGELLSMDGLNPCVVREPRRDLSPHGVH